MGGGAIVERNDSFLTNKSLPEPGWWPFVLSIWRLKWLHHFVLFNWTKGCRNKHYLPFFLSCFSCYSSNTNFLRQSSFWHCVLDNTLMQCECNKLLVQLFKSTKQGANDNCFWSYDLYIDWHFSLFFSKCR